MRLSAAHKSVLWVGVVAWPLPIYTMELLLLTAVGRCQRTGPASGVRSKWCRKSEASRFLPGLQGDRTQHHCLQRSGHRGDHSNRNPSGTQQRHDACVRVDSIYAFVLRLFHSFELIVKKHGVFPFAQCGLCRNFEAPQCRCWSSHWCGRIQEKKHTSKAGLPS